MKTKRIDLRLDATIGSDFALANWSAQPGSLLVLPEITIGVQRFAAMTTRVKTFRFPEPALPESKLQTADKKSTEPEDELAAPPRPRGATKLQPPPDGLPLKDRIFFALQPPVEAWLADRSIQLPCQPFPYQAQGIAFLVPRFSALLGDEMGLGKTMQAIVSLRMLLGAGAVRRVLLVCPKSIVTNWVREFRHWAGDVPTLVIEGSTRRRHALWELPTMPVKIVNYELLARDIDFVVERGIEFDIAVLDEAQRIKNEQSQTARAAREINRKRSWALTGTPLENRLEDLVSIFKFVEPGLIRGEPTPARLRDATQPYILRRLKDQVLDQLPPKVIHDTPIDLTPAQRETYEGAERDGVMRLNDMGDQITIHNVFELVLRLKQICNFDPATGESAKLEQLRNDMEEIAASGRKAIIFSQWVTTLRRLTRALGDYRPLEYHGSLSGQQRSAVIEQFRNDPDCHCLLLSYGAGSVGLNLQFAQYCFLFDRWWNPAVEDQAINRVHRIGQKEPVIITRFVTTATIEERIVEVLDHKRALANDIVPGTEPARGNNFGEEEIFSLFDIKVRPKRAAKAA